MTRTRNLRLGCVGKDVRALKECMFELGFFAPHITRLSNDAFGFDTLLAVRRFQAENGLVADGVAGVLTQGALQQALTRRAASVAQQAGASSGSDAMGASDDATRTAPALPGHIGAMASAAIAPTLGLTTATRCSIVLDALQFAFDPGVPAAYPRSLYIRGGNLYNEDLIPNVVTLGRIATGASRQPQYYDGGRREMMERTVMANPGVTGADCSGGVVGLLRHAGVVKRGFDLCADGFFANRHYRKIASPSLLPGDILHRPGHVGLFVGGGYAVEWMGGAYGCQLTKLANRRGYNFVTGKTARMGAWTGFLRPTYY